MNYKIGIDIGGTNTDAVLVDENNNIIQSTKTLTTKDIIGGFQTAINQIRDGHEKIDGIFIGTTHAINAILEVKNLSKVGVIRLAGYHPDTIPPCFGWPERIKHAVYAGHTTVDGGFNCDGSVITPLNEYATLKAVESLVCSGAEGLVVSGIFSSLYPDQELQVQTWIRRELGESFPLTLSHEIGGIGIIERENAAMLNTALQKNLYLCFENLHQSLIRMGLDCPFFITQNNGTVMNLQQVMRFPILTIASGPKNSFVGGAKLACLNNAVVADIGGTSTDIGVIINGYARRSYKTANISGIQLGFSMPDMLSIALGGGSHLSISASNIDIGPTSVGQSLFQNARSFGGEHLTLTDAAIAYGTLNLSGGNHCMEKELAAQVLSKAYERINYLYKKMACIHTDLPLVLIGGGASLLPLNLLPTNVIIPQYSANANAFGAVLSEIGSTITSVIKLSDREIQIKKLEEVAINKAKILGAKSPRIVEREIIPYHYSPGNLSRVIITAAGVV